MERDNRMSENKYLPIGTTIANKYEIIDILGEDEFELLYLIKAIGRNGSFFVAKELFLETFSFREQNYVSTIVEARGVFNKRKKQIIEELSTLKHNPQYNEIKIYGYEEDNDTIYTIMGFSSNASIERYLQFTPKENTILPELKQLRKKEKRNKGGDKKGVGLFFIFGLFLMLLTLGATIFYVYKFLRTNGVEVEEKFIAPKEISLKEHVVSEPKKPEKIVKTLAPKIVETAIPSISKPIISNSIAEKSTIKKEVIEKEVIEKEIIEKTPIINKPHVDKIEVIAQAKKVANKLAVKVEENKTIVNQEKLPPLAKVKKSIEKKVSIEKNLIEKKLIEKAKLSEMKKPKEITKKKKVEVSAKERIEKFLNSYIHTTSTASAQKTLRFYDKKLSKYFRFKNATHKTILKSQKRYNEKWMKRDFKISSFKIVKRYQKKGVNYYDLKTTTLWHVSNSKGKKRSGKSRGFMRLKEIDGSFKITSIYSLK